MHKTIHSSNFDFSNCFDVFFNARMQRFETSEERPILEPFSSVQAVFILLNANWVVCFFWSLHTVPRNPLGLCFGATSVLLAPGLPIWLHWLHLQHCLLAALPPLLCTWQSFNCITTLYRCGFKVPCTFHSLQSKRML